MRTLIHSTLISMLLLTAISASAADRSLGEFGYWKVTEVERHVLWKKPACVAADLGEKVATLELYAEKDADGLYNDPTFQVVTTARLTGYVRGILKIGTKTIHLQPATTGDAPPTLALIARVDDRQVLREALLSGKNRAMSIDFINQRNAVVKTVNFRLRGSDKALAAAERACKLVWER